MMTGTELTELKGVPGIPNDAYHAADCLSKSKLDLFAKSPARFAARYIERTLEKKTSESLSLGGYLHALILEPETVQSRFVIAPEGIDRRTKAGKEAWSEFMTFAEGREIVSNAMHEQVRNLSAIVLAAWAETTAGCETELTFRTRTEHGWLQCRTDWFERGTGRIYDLKTVGDMGRFERDFWQFGYHLQDAFYRHVIESIIGERPPPMRFLVVETQPPFETATVEVSDEAAELSRIQMFGLLDRYWDCCRSGNWPGIYRGLVKMQAPIWFQRLIEDGAKESLIGFEALAEFETNEQDEQ